MDAAVTAKWNVQSHDLGNGDEIQIVIQPTASQMNYKLLHPSFYCDVNDLGNLDDLAKMVNAPTDWKQTYPAQMQAYQNTIFVQKKILY